MAVVNQAAGERAVTSVATQVAVVATEAEAMAAEVEAEAAATSSSGRPHHCSLH